MYLQTAGVQPWLCGLMSILLLIGCAPAPKELAVQPARDAVSGVNPVALEAAPSPAAASLLPIEVEYRVVLGSDGTLALALLGVDRRILGRVAIAAGDGPHGSPGVRVEVEDVDGRALRVEAWSSAGALYGQAFVGPRAVSWRVRLDDDGSLAGERWSSPRRGAIDELVALQRARALGADLCELAPQLSDARVLAERIALAELALELSLRAWTGHGRAHLPTVGAHSRVADCEARAIASATRTPSSAADMIPPANPAPSPHG